MRLFYPNVKIGKGIRLFGKLIYSIDKTAEVKLGNNIQFRSDTKYNFVGVNKPVSIAVSKNASLDIGENCGFSGTSIYASKCIKIGKYCNFGGNTFLWDTDFHPIHNLARRSSTIGAEAENIEIEDDVFIGANSIILKGVSIGARSVIGAGAVVTKDVPKEEIWAGNPAKFIKKVT